MAICQACSEVNPATARFCLACGNLLAGQRAGVGARKTVTVLFADLADSSGLGERLDPELLRGVQLRFFARMQQILVAHGATVEKFIGDAVMAVFGAPTLHEDDASRAVRAAAQMHRGLADLNQELPLDADASLRMRIGVNTGEVATGDPGAGQILVTGEAVNATSRLQQFARPRETLLGAATYEMVRNEVDVEPVELPASAGRQRRAYLLRALLPTAGATRPLGSALVGRDHETVLLRQVFQRTARTRVGHLLTLLGPAGIGKTRLVSEVLAGIGPDATVLEGRCLPYGEGITYQPVVEMLGQAAGILDTDPPDRAAAKLRARLDGDARAEEIAARLVQLRGITAPQAPPEPGGTPEQTLWAVRRLLTALAATQPLVVLFDDLQLAEPTLLDLIEHVADRSQEVPLLLVCTARGELLERRPAWGGGKPNAITLQLEPLDSAACEELIGNLLGTAELPPGARAHIVARSEGNPLYVEELLGMLIDGGRLRQDRTAWVATTDLAAISVPPTIQALVAARLDQLGLAERAVLQCAAVVGPVFWHGALTAMLAPDARAGLEECLSRLTRKDLVRPERSEVAGEPSYRFRHELIRDAAYRGLPQETRALLHERLADWLASLEPSSGIEHEEILGFHLEQAVHYRAALGADTPSRRALADRAVACLATAADHASARGDVPATVKLLSRATHLTGDHAPARRRLLPRLGSALRQAGDFARAAAVLDEAVTAAREHGDAHVEAFAATERALLVLWTDRVASAEGLREEIERAIRLLEETGDERGLARAWGLLSEVRFFQGQTAAAQAALDRALGHARRAGADRQAARLEGRRILALAYGPAPTDRVVASIEQVLDAHETSPDPVVRAAALAVLAVARAMAGRHDEARTLHDRSTSLFEDIGLKAMTVWQASGRVHLLGGDPVAAEKELRRAYALSEELGQHNYRPVVAAYLSQALYAQERFEEAGRYSVVSRDAAATDSALAQLLWRGAHARVLARRGHLDEAVRLATEAARLTEGTDITEITADVHTDLAEVLHLAGRPAEAAAPLRQALALYEHKGNQVFATRTRRRLEELTAVPAPQ